MLERYKMATCPSKSIPLPICHAILLLSSKTNYDRTTRQLTINDCLIVTIDGSKCTNDITSLHCQ